MSENLKVNILNDVSVIIPLAPKETAWRYLIKDFKYFPKNTEYIFSATVKKPSDFNDLMKNFNAKWILSPPGRAAQLNEGARHSKKQFLYFLHADSRLSEINIKALESSLNKDPHALYYSMISFFDSGILMKLNEFGVWIRSKIMRIPFGDQGFLLSKEIFHNLGNFTENHERGEDHYFIWKAKRNGVPIKQTDGKISTSSRKYLNDGWLKTTLRHMYLTWKQAKKAQREIKLINSGSLAIFVKTPGLSPIKTRLAKTIGKNKAETFYKLSASSIELTVKEVLKDNKLLNAYWAVAEKDASASHHWPSFNNIYQGEGPLGSRLAKIYNELLQKNEFVLLIGADSPHISKEVLLEAAELAKKNFVVGKTKDGGFYLFGGSKFISKDLWNSIPYSSAETFACLKKSISPLGKITLIRDDFDIDEKENLHDLKIILSARKSLNPKQKELLSYIGSI